MSIFNLEKTPISKVLVQGTVGSWAYGTNTPESDVDSMVVYVGKKSYYLGLDGPGFSQEQTQEKNEDRSVFELRKFIKLCLAANPNVLPLLWLRPQDYQIGGRSLIVHSRDIFSSKFAVKTFCGYARGQFHDVGRVEGRAWRLGSQRKELVEKFGYDVKSAMHTVRLLRMLIEFLGDGQFRVFREDAKDLLDIRNGCWSLDKFYKTCEDLFSAADEAGQNSALPEKPNFEAANDLCQVLVGLHMW